MRILPKLLLLTVMTATAMALTASAASATISVTREPTSACGIVVLNVHTVDGGCHVNLRSEAGIPLFAHLPGMGEVQLSNCTIDIEAQIGANGEGYVKRATLILPDPPCTRRVCDEANMTFRPWRLHIREVGVGQEAAFITFCLRTLAESEGATGFVCTLRIPLVTSSTHRYELLATVTQRCAEQSIVSMVGHFTTQGPEYVEIFHPPF